MQRGTRRHSIDARCPAAIGHLAPVQSGQAHIRNEKIHPLTGLQHRQPRWPVRRFQGGIAQIVQTSITDARTISSSSTTNTASSIANLTASGAAGAVARQRGARITE
jgi:hypothetical protein